MMRSLVQQISITEILTLHALVKNDFTVIYAGYDLNMSQPTVSYAIKRLLAKVDNPSKFFLMPLKGEDSGRGGKRLIGFTSAGYVLYKKHILPLAEHYTALLEEVDLKDFN